jgi:hypothetical protein
VFGDKPEVLADEHSGVLADERLRRVMLLAKSCGARDERSMLRGYKGVLKRGV